MTVFLQHRDEVVLSAFDLLYSMSLFIPVVIAFLEPCHKKHCFLVLVDLVISSPIRLNCYTVIAFIHTFHLAVALSCRTVGTLFL